MFFIPTFLYSQKGRLTLRERAEIARELENRNFEIAEKMFDSLRHSIYDKIHWDLMFDSLYLTKFNDSTSIDTFDIQIAKMILERGGEFMLMASVDYERKKTTKREWNNFFEINNYVAKHHKFPCHLIKLIYADMKIRGKLGVMHLKYEFECGEQPTQIRIISRKKTFENH